MKKIFDLAVVNCGELLTISKASDKPKRGADLSDLGLIQKGTIGISKGEIAWVGREKDYRKHYEARREIDAEAKVVMPGLVDPHTHAVFAGRRDMEWAQKLRGTPYLEILKQGGGILRTVDATRSTPAGTLFKKAEASLKKMLSYGTTTVEIKSGYGLNRQQERKILKVIQRLDKETPLDVVSTYLGAHTIPREYQNNPDAYVNQVIKDLPKMKSLADFCDVFCEEGAFSSDQTKRILEAAQQAGFQLKLHAGEFTNQGGIRLAADFGIVSVDHLDVVLKRDLARLARSGAIGVLLPGVSHFLGNNKHAPARLLIDHDVPLALATDYNPGSCPCPSMQEIIHLAVRNLKMAAAEAISAATINAAHAIGFAHKVGSLEVGKQADILLLDIDHYQQLPYFFGANHTRTVLKKGVVIYQAP